MKKTFVKWANKRINALTRRMNSLSDEAKAIIEEQITELQDLVSELEASTEDTDAKAVLEEMRKKIEEKITALAEKIEETPAPEQTAENFLKSRNSVHAWLDAIRKASAQRNAIEGTKKAFSRIWGETLKANGITITEGDEFAFMPDYVRGLIQDAWDKQSNWLNQLKNTGAKRYAVRYNSSSQDNETSRAKGHKNGETKAEESLTFVAKEVDAQFIYKLISLDNLTVFNDDNSLVSYITGELYDQYLYELRRAILIGDGRSSATPDLRIKSFESIDRASTDAFVTVDTFNTSNFIVDELVELLANIINDEDDITLFMNKADYNALRRVQFGDDATPQYVSKEIVAEQLGVKEIIITNMMTTTSGKARFIAARLGGYVTIGDMLQPAFDNWEDKLTNRQYYRLEAATGGATEALKGFAVYHNA